MVRLVSLKYFWVLSALLCGLGTTYGILKAAKSRADDPVNIWRKQALAVVREKVEGRVVFERLGEKHQGIWIQNLGQSKIRRLYPDGRYPRFSPDGQTVFFLRGDDEICSISIKGGPVRALLKWQERIPAIGVGPRSDDLVFVCASGIWKLNTTNLQVVRLESTPKSPAAVDMDADGDMIISTFEGRLHQMWKQKVAQFPVSEWDMVDFGCSAALSPDGRYFSDNNNHHTYMEIKSFSTNEILYKVKTYPERYLVDNEAWTNLNDWMVFNSDTPRHRFAWLYRLGDKHSFIITFTRDSDRPDVHITKVLDRPKVKGADTAKSSYVN